IPLVASFSLMALLCGYLSLYPALAFYLTSRFATSPNSFGLLLISFFAFSEYLRGVVLTGFPWLSFGYTQTDGPLTIL
ncbi:apolipoprotein N-acyltransferase, partial [Pseudoalteromonas sp. SIMBA_162]